MELCRKLGRIPPILIHLPGKSDNTGRVFNKIRRLFSSRCKGDGDPVDVMDIGSKLHQTGEVIQVKILGTIAMIDEGQTDWKIIGIDIQDPLASKFSDISDVDVYMPKLLKSTVEWLRNYKVICTQNVSENTVCIFKNVFCRWQMENPPIRLRSMLAQKPKISR